MGGNQSGIIDKIAERSHLFLFFSNKFRCVVLVVGSFQKLVQVSSFSLIIRNGFLFFLLWFFWSSCNSTAAFKLRIQKVPSHFCPSCIIFLAPAVPSSSSLLLVSRTIVSHFSMLYSQSEKVRERGKWRASDHPLPSFFLLLLGIRWHPISHPLFLHAFKRLARRYVAPYFFVLWACPDYDCLSCVSLHAQ